MAGGTLEDRINKTLKTANELPGATSHRLSPENQQLVADRLLQDAQKNPARVEKFLNVIERERVAFTNNPQRGEAVSSTSIGGSNAHKHNVTSINIDPRKVGQGEFDFIGSSVSRLAKSRQQEMESQAGVRPERFAAQEEKARQQAENDQIVKGMKDRLQTLKEDFPAETSSVAAPAPAANPSVPQFGR